MPCYTPPDPEPDSFSIENHYAAKLYMILAEKTKTLVTQIPYQVVEAKNDKYTQHDITPLLCAKIKKLSKADLDKYVYNGRDKKSRMLADWWDEHQKWDAKRKREERKVANQLKLAKQAKAKLTKAEYNALVAMIDDEGNGYNDEDD